MRRTHRLTPLTPQEEAVRQILLRERFSFRAHDVLEASGERFVVDFLVFHGAGTVIECTFCSKRKSSALTEVRRRCAYMDYRFRLLKQAFRSIRCMVLVEAPNEEQERLSECAKRVLANADLVAVSLEGVEGSLRSLKSE